MPSYKPYSISEFRGHTASDLSPNQARVELHLTYLIYYLKYLHICFVFPASYSAFVLQMRIIKLLTLVYGHFRASAVKATGFTGCSATGYTDRQFV